MKGWPDSFVHKTCRLKTETCHTAYGRSKMPAAPIPPPMHMVTIP